MPTLFQKISTELHLVYLPAEENGCKVPLDLVLVLIGGNLGEGGEEEEEEEEGEEEEEADDTLVEKVNGGKRGKELKAESLVDDEVGEDGEEEDGDDEGDDENGVEGDDDGDGVK